MPFADPAAQWKAAREWMAARRQEWLDTHPCTCGNPSTSIVSTVPGGVPKGAFSARPERRERLLADTITLCDSCNRKRIAETRTASRERSKERQRAANREYMARRRAEQRAQPSKETPEEPAVQVADEPSSTFRFGTGSRNGSSSKKRKAPSSISEEIADLERRMERRRWREERRARLGYGYARQENDDQD